MADDYLLVRHRDNARWRIAIRFAHVAGFGDIVALHRLHDDCKAVLYGKEAEAFTRVARHVAQEGIDTTLGRVILYTHADGFVIRDINHRE